ncbi:hypothetical protein ACS0TY_029999 [Phlomoides rotata]
MRPGGSRTITLPIPDSVGDHADASDTRVHHANNPSLTGNNVDRISGFPSMVSLPSTAVISNSATNTLGASLPMQGIQPHAVCMGSKAPASLTSVLPEVASEKPPQKLSYADAVTNRNRENISNETIQAMKPVRKGQYLTVTVDENLYKGGVSELRDSLIGRIIHVKGDKPLAHEALITHLGDHWNIRTPWNMIPIGEGYYSIQFSCDEDREHIFSRRSWQLKSGVLRLQRWVLDFNPYRVTTSVVQAWIRISELSLEYWNKHIIMALASAVGTIIKIDDRMLNRTMGRIVFVLVKLDLKQDREEYHMFERAGHCSFVGVQYERLPEFCKFCNVLGHATGLCVGANSRSKSGKATTNKGDDPKEYSKSTVGGTNQWVQRTFHAIPEVEVDRDKPKSSGEDTVAVVICQNSFVVLT